jgi:thiamine biosynthesis lipoprotein
MNKKNLRITIGIILGISLIGILHFLLARLVKLDSGHRPVMGTFAHIVAVANDSVTAEKSIETAFEQLEAVDNSMSDYKPDSQLSVLNREGYKKAIKVSEPLFEVLQISLSFSRQTNGAFDITVGPLVDLFHSAEKKQAAPTPEQIANAKEKTGFEKLILNEKEKSVRFAVEGMRLDLGGIAKGYAIDKAVEAMQKAGATGGMVDVGGDIRCFGTPQPGRDKWLIGLQDPNDPGDVGTEKYLLVLGLTDAAIATSGDYRRFTLIEGKKYSHIIDSSIAQSARALSSVTIIAENATEADALATAVSVMGIEKGLDIIENRPDTEAILMLPAPGFELIQTTGAKKYID